VNRSGIMAVVEKTRYGEPEEIELIVEGWMALTGE
jgi:hypothetical protein